MKYLSRLTALLLAFVLLFSSSVGVIAESDISDLTRSGYDQMVSAAKEAAEAEAAAAAQEAASQPIINEGGEIIEYNVETTAPLDAPYYEQSDSVTLAMNAAGEEGEQNVTLSQYGVAELSASGAGNWQVYVAGQWVNMAGEDSSDIEITFAKVQSLFELTGAAKVRYASADGAQVSDVANIGLYYGLMTTPETDDTFAAASTFSLRSASNDAVALANDTTEDDGLDDRVTVEIAYQYQNGDTVANSYVASITPGSDLKTSVISLPVQQGYVASYVMPNDDTVEFTAPTEESNGSIRVTLQDVVEDIQYVVTYVPDYVPFTVEHYQQNVSDDGYTKVEGDTKVYSNKKTGEQVGDVANTYPGFTALWYDTTTKVGADGQTVINVYYERNYNLVLFDLDGGYGVEPIYARYGAPMSVGTPTKPGYTFAGWIDEAGDPVEALPTTVPAAAKTTYKATWTENENAKVTVVFWGETANCTDDAKEYDYIDSGTLEAEVGSSFTYTDGMTVDMYYCGQEEHTHDDTCTYACGLEIHTHSQACYEFTCTTPIHTHDDSCYQNCEIHSHSTKCYDGVGDKFEASASEWRIDGTESEGSIGQSARINGTGTKYIYIDGTWYKYTGSASIGSTASPNCGKTLHTAHTDGCLTCGMIEHAAHTDYTGGCYALTCEKTEHASHSDSCGYSCGKIAHTHSNACTEMEGDGLDSSLWTYVSSETKTVAADGSTIVNVYYDRTEKTLTFNYNYSSYRDTYNSTETITAKWGANISTQYKAIAANADSTFWSKTSDGEGPYTNYFGVMPQTSATYYHRSANGDTGTMYYYGQDLNGEYTVELFSVPNVGGYTVTDEDRYEFEGFTYDHGTSNGSSCSNAKFYYTRNSYTLDFNNGFDVVKSESVLYEQTLSEYSSYEPTPPYYYEAGSVTFDGWYLNPECTGEEVDLNTYKMPAANVILYAKWQKVTHTVQVYPTVEDMTTDTNQIGDTLTITHGEKIPTDKIPETPENGNYTFVAWFYQEEQEDGTFVEKAFDFENMQVNRDLKIYAKWSSNEPVEFTVYYKLLDENGNETDTLVAETVTGKTLINADTGTMEITLDAKIGSELYPAYQEGHFPTVSSHTLTVDINNTAEQNSFTFKYKPVEKVPYKVMYVEVDANGNIIGEMDEAEAVVRADNSKAVVTETYARIPGYMPDEFQKRLIVSADGEAEDVNGNLKVDEGENLIIFYYHVDTVNAFYTVSHYIEPIGGAVDYDDWQQYGLTDDFTGVIGQEYSAEALEIDGFTFKEAYVDLIDSDGNSTTGPITDKENIKENLSDGGMDFRLYYSRNKYPYLVEYRDLNTDEEIYDAVIRDPAYYQDSVSETISEDLKIHGYELASDETQSITIQIDGDGSANAPIETNIITYYFQKSQFEINYIGVAPDGTLITSDEQKEKIGSVSVEKETGTALDGPVNGSTATPVAPTYKFVGWYSDEACQNQITTDATYVPQPVDGDKNPDTQALYESATYYAKFDWDVGKLKITKSGMENDESAIFAVKLTTASGAEKTWNVVLNAANPSVTLANLEANASYEVTEVGDWSKLYSVTESTGLSGTIPGGGVATATIENQRTDKWLNDESSAKNVFDAVSVTE